MKLKLTDVRLSFPDLFTAKAFQPGDAPKFKATFLIEKGSAQHAAVEKAITEAAREKWGAKADKLLASIRGNPNRFCYQDGDTKAYDGYEGMMALSSKNALRPTVVDADKTPLVEADGKPYAGCYVHAVVDVFAYDNAASSGISASLMGVQFFRDGDSFTGGRAADLDDFDDVTSGATADDLA